MLEMINSLILARNLLKTRSFHQLSTFMLPLKHRKVCVCSSPCLPTKTTRWIRGPNQTRFLCGDGESHIPGNSTNLTLFLDVELILYQYFIILKGYNLKLFEMIFLLKLYICMYTYIYIYIWYLSLSDPLTVFFFFFDSSEGLGISLEIFHWLLGQIAIKPPIKILTFLFWFPIQFQANLLYLHTFFVCHLNSLANWWQKRSPKLQGDNFRCFDFFWRKKHAKKSQKLM